jgi:hypothetical protein
MSGSVVPARPAFLAIYNPSLGTTDETAYEQIFYFYSESQKESLRKDGVPPIETPPATKGSRSPRPTTQEEQQNEQLRKVGLARGMIEFAK